MTVMSVKKPGKDDNNPGASRHGNFINYYQFHSASERIRQLPRGVWETQHPERKYIALDVGCNSGNLTVMLHRFLNECLAANDINLLGVDLDPILIERARENNDNSAITFECLDFMSNDTNHILHRYLRENLRERFDAIFCFSITMWIHLNYGDEGLKIFLENVCSLAETIVIEPQPWKCYRNASRRLRRSGEEDFPLINQLKLTGNMEKHIQDIICSDKCNFERIIMTKDNNWGRKLMIFRRHSKS